MTAATKAYVLMTAMPPTKGHLHLIQFATHVADTAEVILCTQPDEPYAFERLEALRKATAGMRVNIHHIHQELPQEPEVAVGFWDMWLGFLRMFGLQEGDYIVASEMYGQKLAEISGATFIPYDLDRSIYYSKATKIRENPLEPVQFSMVLPEFQPVIRQRITIFGAESTGKTTLSRELAYDLNGHWLPEWARPYLENCGNVVDRDSMTKIWMGQKALQKQGLDMVDKPYIIQDTDLFSTVGYWDLFASEWGDSMAPSKLVQDALDDKSDLYIITRSNIPFEKDPLRYGGDKRQSTDEEWIDICKTFGLNYVVLGANSLPVRLGQAKWHIANLVADNVHMHYDRVTKESLAEK